MGSSTRPDQVIKFSELETKLIDLLPIDGAHVNSRDLAAKYYGDEIPLNALGIIGGRLRSISAKAERAKMPWRIHKSGRAGPNPSEFWRTSA